MAIDWIWLKELDPEASNSDITGSGTIHISATVPLVAAQLSLAGVTLFDTTGELWPWFTGYLDQSNASHSTGYEQPVVLFATEPKWIDFSYRCLKAAGAIVVSVFGWS